MKKDSLIKIIFIVIVLVSIYFIISGLFSTDGGGSSDDILEQGLQVSSTSVTINVDEDFLVTANVIPDNATYKTVEWRSSNPTIATVDNGLVVGVGQGKAEITATTTNKKISKKIVVNVSNIEITNITLDKSTETIKKGETLSLIKTITPSNASNQNVSWDSSNNNVATVDSNGIVTGKNTGRATITVRTANGKVASCMVEVK